ncbi:MAG: ImmA/IrrE family metallo-endopeptidase [Candidatus Hydrogenedentes bacterium]|nr:ImmA/IrrE family metallo-endopeptidase [Candidatus Hydrogenedentota bacterium]
MPINQAMLAKRLKEARESAQVTQEAAAEALALPRTAIVHIEAGNRAVSTLELVELAKLYGRDVASFFTEEEAAKPDEDALLTLYRVDPLFRDNPQVKESVSKCIEICREGMALEEILDLSRRTGPPAYHVEPPRSPAEAVQQGERTAADERKRIGIGDSPVPDMADLITTQGVWASGAELPDEMSGLFLRHPAIGLTILVNYHHAATRKRFSYAHEYAHCLLDRTQPVSITTSHNQNNLSEVRANAFAAAFLMPAGGVSAFLNSLDKGAPSRQTLHVYTPVGEHPDHAIEAQRRPAPGSQKIVYQDVAQLASYFRVSYAAAVYRLRNLANISQTECTSLLADNPHANSYLKLLRLIDDHEAVEEPKPDRHLVNQVAYLAVEAFRRDEISRGRVLEIAKTLGIEKGTELVSLAKAALVG